MVGAAVLAEGGRRAGGGVGETVVEAVVGDAGEAVVGVVGVVGKSDVGTRGGGVSHRGRFLELDIDTASRGVFDGPFGQIVEVVLPQAVAGRSQGGWDGRGSTRDPPVRQEDVAAVHAAHEGGQHRVDVEKLEKGACVRASVSEWKGSAGQGRNVFGKGTCSLSDTDCVSGR